MVNPNTPNMYQSDLELDFSYLKNVTPKNKDLLLPLNKIDIDDEIQRLAEEIDTIDLRSIPFDKYDFVIAFVAGLMGAACDIILGKPADGYGGLLPPAKEPTINDEFGFGLGKHLKKYDLKNNPIDKTIPGIPVGDHRLYSYGHDLTRVFQTVRLMLTGRGPVGISGLGGEVILEQAPENWIQSLVALGINPSAPSAADIIKILVILFLHLYKDYCSARSLPIPGLTYIAKLNNNTMPKFLDELTNEKEMNLRTLNGQLFSLASIEIVIGIYSFIRKKADNYSYSSEQWANKKRKLLLLSHSVALVFNAGKVMVTSNPAFINFPQIMRVVKLGWEIIKAEANIKHKSVEKVNMTVLKNQLETASTLILLDDAIFYTRQVDDLIKDMMDKFHTTNHRRRENIDASFAELTEQLNELKGYNT